MALSIWGWPGKRALRQPCPAGMPPRSQEFVLRRDPKSESKTGWSGRDILNDLQYQPERRPTRRWVRQVTDLHRLLTVMAILGSFQLVTREQCRRVESQMIGLLLDRLGSRKSISVPSPHRKRQ